MTRTQILLSLAGLSLFLAACNAKTPPAQPDTISQTELEAQREAEKVESTGNVDADLNAINQEISDLDATADFDSFTQKDLTE